MAAWVHRWLGVCGGVVLLGVTGGCRTLEFYTQAAVGQWEVLAKREPIERVIEETDDEALRARLQLTQRLLDFAGSELAMPSEGSYQSYAALGREHLVWVVVAAPELSLEPKQWWYPLVGRLNYRGYFCREDAGREAQRLRERGYETFIGGVDAYSTLGWFRDPVLDTFVGRPEWAYAELIFHELAHVKYYVSGDTRFNEGLAQAVGREGVRRWLKATGRASWVARYDAHLARVAKGSERIHAATEQLRAIYARDLPDAAKRREKARVIESLRDDLRGLSAEGGEFAGWVDGPINHARLVAFSTYESEVPQFRALLKSVNGDFQQFWPQVEKLAKQRK